jgi:tRNA uridine 5-carbamoylmethylation protein Kti12
MKFLPTLTIIVSLCLSPPFTATAEISNSIQIESTNGSAPGSKSIEKTDKEKIMEDAQKLGKEFKNLFNDLTELSKNTIEPLANSISEWITDNYATLSEVQREKLVEFIEKLKKEYKNVEKMSLETLRDLLNNFKEFIGQLREEESPDSTNSLTRT